MTSEDIKMIVVCMLIGAILVILPHIISMLVSVVAFGVCLYVVIPMAREYWRQK